MKSNNTINDKISINGIPIQFVRLMCNANTNNIARAYNNLYILEKTAIYQTIKENHLKLC